MPQACPSQLSLTRTSYHHCIWIWNRKDDKIIQKQSKTKHCMVLRMKTPSFVKVNEKEKFEIQLSGKGLTNESLRTSIEELEQFLRAEGTEKRTLDLDLTHNPDVTDDSDDSDPGEAGFTSGFNFSAKAAISKGHFASFATASTTQTCGRGGKDFWARHWWHWPKRSARKAGEGAWTIQTIHLERCSKRNRRDPLCSCLQCQADKWGSKSAITPAGTSSSISLGAGWGRGRWEGHLELVEGALVGLGFAGEEIHWSWAERQGRLWHGVRLCFGSGRMRRRRNWRSWHHLKHLAAKSTMKTMDRCERMRKAARPSISRQTSDDMESIMEEEEDEHEELISGIGRWACLRPFCGWLFLRLQMKRPMSRSCYLACGVRGDAYTCQRRQ